MVIPRSPTARRRAILVGSLAAIGVAGIVIVPALAFGDAWEGWVSSLPAMPLIAALALLLVFGFPVSVLHFATGARFGMGPGFAAIAATTLIHLAGGLFLARWVERPVQRLVHRLGWSVQPVPPDAAGVFTLWVGLLPGISYGVKNVVPPLAGVAWRPFLAIAYPLHVAQGCVGLALGRMTMQFTWPFAAGAAVYLLALAGLTRWLTRRLRARPVPSTQAPPDRRSPTPDRPRPADDPM